MDRLRLDKWLWAARFFKTRAIAAEEIGKGRVSVNEQVAKASREVKAGDVLAFRQGSAARTVVVLGVSRAAWPGAGRAGALRGNAGERRRPRGRRPGAPAEPGAGVDHRGTAGRPRSDRRQLADWNRWSASVDGD